MHDITIVKVEEEVVGTMAWKHHKMRRKQAQKLVQVDALEMLCNTL